MTRRERVAWVVLIAAALLVHLVALGARPPHHDESIHGHFAHQLLAQGEYRYDPTYHGPLQIYSITAIFVVFGETVATARLWAALCGVALVALPLMLRRRIGAGPAWWCGLLIAISPVFLYYSRFAREDVPVELFTAAALVCVALVRRYGWRPLPWVGVFAALHATTKETFYVVLPLVGVGAIVIALREGLLESVVKLARWLQRYKVAVWAAVLWFIAICFVAYTFFFIHPEDFFFPGKAISYWYGQHKIQRVGGPWHYHLPRLALYEFLPIGAALVWAVRRRARMRRFETFCLSWGIASLAMYAYLGEKVPWLETHQVLPFIPLAAMQLAHTFSPLGRWWSKGLGGAAIAATLWSALASSFLYGAMTPANRHAELIVYVQTTPETQVVVERGLQLAAANPTETVAAATGEASWPFSWQWEKLPVVWSLPSAETKPPLVVCDTDDEAKVRAVLGGDYTMRRIPLRAWWVEQWSSASPAQILRWFFTRVAWSEIGSTDVLVFEKTAGAGNRPAQGGVH